MPPPLSSLQRWMQAVITHPEGISAGMASPEAQSQLAVPDEELSSVVLPSSKLSSQERLAVYGNAYFGRLLECMREMFPALRAALETDVFDQFAFGYLTAHPPRSYTLEHLADGFLEFLQATREVIAEPGEDWPDFVIDLGRLEWNIEQVFDGPGMERTEPLSAAQLQAMDPQHWPAAKLVPAPCLRFLAFRFPVNDYYTDWRASARTEAHLPPIPAPAESFLALTRRNYVVRRYPLDADQYRLLIALVEGKSVGQAIEAAVTQSHQPNHLANELGNWFQRWTAAEFFVAVE